MNTNVSEVNQSTEEIAVGASPVTQEQTPVATPSASVEEVKPKGSNKTLVSVLVAILVVLLLGGAAYAGYYFGFFGDGSEEEEQPSGDYSGQGGSGFQDEEESAEEVNSEYLGTYINATIPNGWQIIEYEDGEGSDMLMSGTEYSGLTGLSILTDEDEEVFQVYAVMGIGGIDICSTVAKFADTPQSYIEEIYDLTTDYNSNVEDPEPMPVVEQIASGLYTELSFLEYSGRRVDTTIYWNDLDNANVNEFHPLCGLAAGVLSFDTLTFEYDSGMGTETGSSYVLKIVGDPTDETLLLLDEVMSSITLN